MSSQTPEPSGTTRTLRSEVRNPRRRQRQNDGESLRAAPRRKRSKLSEDAFAPRGSIEDGQQSDVGSNVVMNGHATSGARKASGTPMPTTHAEMPVRGGKKRTAKGDGATVLTSNKMYSVKLLPSTPKELRKQGVEYRGSVLSVAHQHLALAVTREKAYVWDYATHTTVSNARVFDVPFPAGEDEAIPFGALIPKSGGVGAQEDTGLLLVSATTGKIVYYESIERAASLGLFQEKKTGVEGTIAGFSLSETLTGVTSAEHAGFVLTLSSGRILHLTLRDAQGRARIFTEPLRPGDESRGGLFGSIKGLWSGAWKRDVMAVRTRALEQRGPMQVISLTERCEVQTWDLQWSGRHQFRSTVDLRERIIDEVKKEQGIETQGRAEQVSALDFVVADGSATASSKDELMVSGSEQPTIVIILLRAGSSDAHDYLLAEVALAGEDSSILDMTPLRSYHGQSIGASKPTLLLPKPGHTALVAFEDAVVLASTTKPEILDDPNAQLHEISYIEPQPFEDAVHLRGRKDLAIMGLCTEETRGGHASSIAFVKSAGLVRFSVTNPAGDKERGPLPAKTKIEQSVFYGALQENILDFTRTNDTQYPREDIETAALETSHEILCSSNSFISDTPTSLESQLDYRAKALHALITHVQRNCTAMSRSVLWQLLWDAEKVAAAQTMWRAFEEHKEAAKAATGKRSATVVDELCAQLAETARIDVDDPVRHFFIKELPKTPLILSHIKGLLETLQHDQSERPEKVVRYVTEADDLWHKALKAAFAFRDENATVYGIAADHVKDGVLDDAAEYAGLEEFWTSTVDMFKASSKIATLSRDFAKDVFEQEHKAPEVEKYIKQISETNPQIIQLCCLIYRERIGWLSSRPSQRDRELAEKIEANFEAERYDQFRALAGVGGAQEGMILAEKYRDMQTLTELVVGESQYYMDELAEAGDNHEHRAIAVDMLQNINTKISRYFDKFGEPWANAFFDEAFSGSRAGAMLEEAQNHWKDHLTTYLRADPSRAKICWINDVTTARDYSHAGKVMLETALDHETQLWAKKVELSMGKLALMAAEEDTGASSLDVDLARPDRELVLVDIQERLYLCLRREAMSALDRFAAIELTMDKFGTKSREYPSLQRLLEANIDRLLNHFALSIEELLDVLTLMDSRIYTDEAEEPEGNLEGAEFVLAFTALNAAAPSLPQDRFESLLQMVWKRCYAADDWGNITSIIATRKSKTDLDIMTRLHATVAWRTFYNLHEQAFFARPDCAIRVLPPSECLGAGCRPEEIAYRFSGNDDLLDPILHDNKIQDEIVQVFVTDRKLDEWIRDCEKDAKKAIMAESEVVAERRRMERELVVEKGAGGKVNGVGKANGTVHCRDGDGDVDMN